MFLCFVICFVAFLQLRNTPQKYLLTCDNAFRYFVLFSVIARGQSRLNVAFLYVRHTCYELLAPSGTVMRHSFRHVTAVYSLDGVDSQVPDVVTYT